MALCERRRPLRRRDHRGRPGRARATVLATGGGAALWRRTTNPWGAIGAGAVLAHAAGADLADLEFCQFHPTALALPGRPHDGALITEAVRGEGATLLDAAGRRFTDELAPRDQVTAAILDRMDADASKPRVARPARARPGAVPERLRRSAAPPGSTPSAEPVPVAPAAHYLMGGVATDLDGAHQPAGPATRSASAPAPASTAPTASPRTRSASASSSALAPPARPLEEPESARRPRPRLALRAADRGDPRGRLAPRRAAPRRRPASPRSETTPIRSRG